MAWLVSRAPPLPACPEGGCSSLPCPRTTTTGTGTGTDQELNFEDVDIQKDSDGFVCVSGLCSRAGMTFGRYQMFFGKHFLQRLAEELGTEVTKVYHGGTRGTWVHPRVLTDLAIWLGGSRFRLHASRWVERALREVPGMRSEYDRQLGALKPDPRLALESEVRQRLSDSLEGARQNVMCDNGEADIVTADEVIEVKWIAKYLHALGQVQGYAPCFPGRSMRVHLFGTEAECATSTTERITRLLETHDVRVSHEVIATESADPVDAVRTSASFGFGFGFGFGCGWWTDVDRVDQADQADCALPFDVPPPWDRNSRDRLVTLTMPFGVPVTLDPDTGLFHADRTATAFGKRASDWVADGSTDLTNTSGARGIAHTLANMLGTTPARLAYVTARGIGTGTGIGTETWLHMRLICHFANWCHTPMAVHAFDLQLKFYTGQITTEQSQAAFTALASTAAPVSVREHVDDHDDGFGPPPVSGQNPITTRLINQRARIRGTAVRATNLPVFDIPSHLRAATGVFAGVLGRVEDKRGRLHYHLKLDRAVETPVATRIDHIRRADPTFQLTWMAGVEASLCWFVEVTMKLAAKRLELELELRPVPGTHDEWLVPLDRFANVHAAIVQAVQDDHAPLITTADHAGAQTDGHQDRALEMDKFNVRFNGKVQILQALVNGGDHAMQNRALEALERM